MNVTLRSIAAVAALFVTCTTARTAETVRIKALDCVLEVPADYEIDVAPNSSVMLSAPGSALGARIRITELNPAFPNGESFKLLGRVVTGPLTVERFSYEIKGKPSLTTNFTIVRGRRQQAQFDAMPDAQVEGQINQCLKSMAPEVAAASARKESGCASTLPLEDMIASLGGDVRAQPVFAGGGLKGWRLYGTGSSGQLRAHAIKEGSLMTHVCGMPAREIFVNDGNACCAVDATSKFDVTFHASDHDTQVNISRIPVKN